MSVLQPGDPAARLLALQSCVVRAGTAIFCLVFAQWSIRWRLFACGFDWLSSRLSPGLDTAPSPVPRALLLANFAFAVSKAVRAPRVGAGEEETAGLSVFDAFAVHKSVRWLYAWVVGMAWAKAAVLEGLFAATWLSLMHHLQALALHVGARTLKRRYQKKASQPAIEQS